MVRLWIGSRVSVALAEHASARRGTGGRGWGNDDFCTLLLCQQTPAPHSSLLLRVSQPPRADFRTIWESAGGKANCIGKALPTVKRVIAQSFEGQRWSQRLVMAAPVSWARKLLCSAQREPIP